jgi:hypothetical protein
MIGRTKFLRADRECLDGWRTIWERFVIGRPVRGSRNGGCEPEVRTSGANLVLVRIDERVPIVRTWLRTNAKQFAPTGSSRPSRRVKTLCERA